MNLRLRPGHATSSQATVHIVPFSYLRIFHVFYKTGMIRFTPVSENLMPFLKRHMCDMISILRNTVEMLTVTIKKPFNISK